MQAEGEPFEQFYRNLQLKSKSYEFSTLTKSMIRDQIVYGTASKKFRQRLLREADLTPERAVEMEMCKAEEIAAKQIQAWGTRTNGLCREE